MIAKAISMDLRQIAMLLAFFIVYVVLGGVVFMLIEAPHEMEHKELVRNSAIEFKENLKLLDLSPQKANNLTHILNAFFEAQDVNTLDDQPEKELLSSRWDFFNSFFFAITVVTTIGYGHLSPSTPAGRIFCLVYALFGIPMTGILLGAIGDRFSRCFLDEIHRVRRRNAKTHFQTKLMVIKRALLFFVPWFAVFLVMPALIFFFLEKWTFVESFYYCFITLSTIGFGDLVAGQFDGHWVWLYKIVVVLWIIFGLAYLSMILNFISQGLRSHRFTHVVHSIRRMSGPSSLHGFKHHGLRHHKKDFHKENKNVPFIFGGNFSEPSTPGSVTPTPSPSLHAIPCDTSSSGSSGSRKKSTRKPFVRRLCCALKKSKRKSYDKDAKCEKEAVSLNNKSQSDALQHDVIVIVTDVNCNSHVRCNSISSEMTAVTPCESPCPQTRADLSVSRKAFFQTLDSQDFPVSAV